MARRRKHIEGDISESHFIEQRVNVKKTVKEVCDTEGNLRYRGKDFNAFAVTVETLEREYSQLCNPMQVKLVAMNMSGKERLVLDWIMHNLDFHIDRIYINPQSVRDDINNIRMEANKTHPERPPLTLSDDLTFVYSALKKLIHEDIIAKKGIEDYMYFVNPMMIFKGDPLKLFKNRKKTQQQAAIQALNGKALIEEYNDLTDNLDI